MISCKRATELISKSMEEHLTLGEEMQLRVHLFVCEFCEKFKQQAAAIRRALHRRSTGIGEGGEICIPEGAKERLKEKLKRKGL